MTLLAPLGLALGLLVPILIFFYLLRARRHEFDISSTLLWQHLLRDLAAHVGTWLAEAGRQLERIGAGTYEGHDIDVDAVNARLLDAMSGQPWEVAWSQANAGRTRMVEVWYELREPSEEAAWWIHKAGSQHYGEHLGRLKEWVEELVGRRTGADRADAG